MKSKILFILHLPPPIHGSAMVGNYIKGSEIINNKFESRFINLGTSSSIDEIGTKGLIKLRRYINIIFDVISQLLKFKPNLCYLAITAKGSAFYKDALIAILIKLFRIKLVFHLHNKGVKERQYKFIDNLIYRFVFSNTEVILLSEYLYPDIQKYVTTERIHYCPNGIPLEVQSSKFKVQSSETTQILFLSNLIESKGVFILLEACSILQFKQFNFHCIFVGGIGDVSEQQFYNKVKQLNVENCVNYAGRKYDEEKELVFLQADIFVLPSNNDCFPLVLLEAMQHSLPIVSTYEGAIPTIVEDSKNGFLVAQKDANALAEKLGILIADKDLRIRMGKAGTRKV